VNEGLQSAANGDFRVLQCPDEAATREEIAAHNIQHVIVPGFESELLVRKIIQDSPGLQFSAIDNIPEYYRDAANLQSIVFAEDEGGFLAGAIAGELSATRNKAVGFIGGVPFDSVRKFRAGYIAGVTYACADCKVYSHTIMNFGDTDSGSQIAQHLTSTFEIDVLFAAAGGTGSEAIRIAAESEDTLVIGVDADQWVTVFNGEERGNDNFVGDSGHENVISSVVKRVSTAIERIVNTEFEGGTILNLDIRSSGVDLAPCHAACNDLPPSVQARADDILSKFRTDTLSIRKFSDFSGGLMLRGQFFPETGLAGNSFTPVITYGELPPETSGPATAVFQDASTRDKTLYMFGGVQGEQSPVVSDDLWSFNAASMTWVRHSIATLKQGEIRPKARHQATLATLQDGTGRIALFGGQSTEEVFDDLWFLSAASFLAGNSLESWTQVTPASSVRPGARFGHASASIGSDLYVFGGKDDAGRTFNDLWRFNTELNTWQVICSLCNPSERGFASLTQLNGELVLHGGLGQDNQLLLDTWIYTPGQADFTRAANGPAGRSLHQATPLFVRPPGHNPQTVLAVIGGDFAANTPEKTRTSIAYYLYASNEWVMSPLVKEVNQCSTDSDSQIVGEQAQFVNRRNFVAFAVTDVTPSASDDESVEAQNDKLFLFGGSDDEGNRIARTEIFHASENDVTENFNRVSPVVKGTLITLSLGVFGLGVALLTWTWKKKRHPIVLASQVPFLAMVAFGAMVSVTAIIPATFDDADDTEELARNGAFEFANLGCQLKVWLYGTGFLLTFTPLFAKVYRVQKIFSNTKLKRIKITTQQLALTCFSLICVEWSIILAWQLIDPVQYVRIGVQDELGNTVSSTGACRSESSTYFLGLLVLFHLCILFYGNILCFKARKIEDRFAETQTIALVLVSLLQILTLAIPVMILVVEIPLTYVVVESGVIFLQSVSVLVFIFGKKVLKVRSGKTIELSSSMSNSPTGMETSHNSEKSGLPYEGVVHYQTTYLTSVFNSSGGDHKNLSQNWTSGN